MRGWQVHNYAVNLEPPFSPIKPETNLMVPTRDDARVAGILERFIGSNRRFRQRTLPDNDAQQTAPQSEDAEVKPAAFYRSEEPAELEIRLSPDAEVTPALTEQFLLSLSSASSPLSFELLAEREEITFQMACEPGYSINLENQLQTFFTNCQIRRCTGTLKSLFNDQSKALIADFGLSRSFLFPLQTFRSFNPDPLTGMIGSLGNLRADEKAVFQVLFQKTRFPWAEEAQKLFASEDMKSIWGTQIQAFREKLSAPLFAITIRLAVQAESRERAWELLKIVGGNLARFSAPNLNELIALSNDNLSFNNHFLSLVGRTSYRSGMILNAAELSALAHPPSASIKSEKLKRAETNTKPLPASALNHSFVLGINEHHGSSQNVTLSITQRTKHMHLIGASGSGKSTLLSNMMIQDLDQGNGFACFDPHGDLIDAVLERIPEHRLKDVVLFDPADENYPIGFNILSAHSELEKTLLASDLVSIFRRFSTNWGDVMNSILANAVLAFLDSERGGNLLDLKRFLIDKNFREDFLATVKDDEIRYYWLVEFPQLKGKPFAPLLTRLDTFLRSKLVRHIVSARENRLDFRRMMDERKVLLVRLSLGSIGEENAYLLGSLLVSKLHQATLSRQNIAEEERQPFFLYLDEAHHFVTESMNQILSGVRKYKLGLVLAHQQLRQFQTGESDILSSVLANCYTRICFRLDDADAERLAKGFSFFTADHLKNLGVGEAILRLEQSRYDFNLKAFPLPVSDAATAERAKKAVIKQTRTIYAQPKAEIKAQNQPSGKQADQAITVRPELKPETKNSNPIFDEETRKITEQVNSARTVQPHPGRGGRHHQELQAVILRMAENYGFRAEIEKSVLDGVGSVDVSLEKENLRIACEVSVTSTIDYETGNVLKCLTAGYDYVVVVVSDQKKLKPLETQLKGSLPPTQAAQIKVCALPDLLTFLRDLTASEDESAGKGRESKTGQRLNLAAASEFLNVGPSTLYRWAREGRVPFFRVGREYHFDRDELVLIGRQDLSGKRKAQVKLEPLKIEKNANKDKKAQDARYRKLLKLD